MHFIRLRCCIVFVVVEILEIIWKRHFLQNILAHTQITYTYVLRAISIGFGSVFKIENATIKLGIMISFLNVYECDKGLENVK